MKSFEVDEGNPQDFVTRVKRELATRGLDEYADLSMEGPDLVVRFKWMGTSVLRYRVSNEGNGFRADLDDERMSPFHAPFRSAFEDRFDQVLSKVGARTTTT